MSSTPSLYLSTRSRLRSTQEAALPVAAAVAAVSQSCPPDAAVNNTPTNKFQTFVTKPCPRPYNKSPTEEPASIGAPVTATTTKKLKMSAGAGRVPIADSNSHLEAKMDDMTLESALVHDVQPVDTLPIQEQDPEEQVVQEQTNTPEPQVAHPLVEGGKAERLADKLNALASTFDDTHKITCENRKGYTIGCVGSMENLGKNGQNKDSEDAQIIYKIKAKFGADIVQGFKEF